MILNICEKKFFFFYFTEKVTCTDESGLRHLPGDEFNDDKCESRCTCTDNGEIVCQPLNCPAGLIRRGMKMIYFSTNKFRPIPYCDRSATTCEVAMK